jgi:hypothetical protein
LANAATHQAIDMFVLLDDIEIFNSNDEQTNFIGGGVTGLNF